MIRIIGIIWVIGIVRIIWIIGCIRIEWIRGIIGDIGGIWNIYVPNYHFRVSRGIRSLMDRVIVIDLIPIYRVCISMMSMWRIIGLKRAMWRDYWLNMRVLFHIGNDRIPGDLRDNWILR